MADENRTAQPMANPRNDPASVKAGVYEMYIGLNESDIETLHVVGLILSSISFLATCISGYWLVRMRRNFRHDLIVLLIVSDFLKSLSSVIYGIVTIGGSSPLESGGVFCQVSGFFYSLGIEAADSAVFLIALHSTVFIFWPNRAGGESGLYPYRRYAFTFFGLWPTLMASLAFVKGDPAYVNTGQSCYLPTAPWWYRGALSWIPRYLVLLIILLMYGASYAYVRFLMRRYSRRSSELPLGRPDRRVPPTPQIDYHDLIPPDPESAESTTHYALSSVGTRHSSARHSSARHSSARATSLSTRPAISLSPSRAEDEQQPHSSLRDTIKHTFDRLQHPGTRMKGTWSWAGFESQSSGLDHDHQFRSPAVSPLGHRVQGVAAPMPGPSLESLHPHHHYQREPSWRGHGDDAPGGADAAAADDEDDDGGGTSTPPVLSHSKRAFLKRRTAITSTPTSGPKDGGGSQDSSTTTLRGRSSPDFYRRVLSNNQANGSTPADERIPSGLDIEAKPIASPTSAPMPVGNLPAVLLPSSRLLQGSQVDLVAMLRQGPIRLPADTLDDTFNNSYDDDPVIALDQATFEGGGILRSRDRVRRQLRLLFIYPAVYACVWIFPFVGDVCATFQRRREREQERLPLWMLWAVLASLAVQGLCDTVVFWARERPWRHMRVGFWRSFGLDFLKGWRFSVRKDSGRSREEMFNDGARARNRRDEEVVREGAHGRSVGGRTSATGPGVQWWDVEEGGDMEHAKGRASQGSQGGREKGSASQGSQGGRSEKERDGGKEKESPVKGKGKEVEVHTREDEEEESDQRGTCGEEHDFWQSP